MMKEHRGQSSSATFVMRALGAMALLALVSGSVLILSAAHVTTAVPAAVPLPSAMTPAPLHRRLFSAQVADDAAADAVSAASSQDAPASDVSDAASSAAVDSAAVESAGVLPPLQQPSYTPPAQQHQQYAPSGAERGCPVSGYNQEESYGGSYNSGSSPSYSSDSSVGYGGGGSHGGGGGGRCPFAFDTLQRGPNSGDTVYTAASAQEKVRQACTQAHSCVKRASVSYAPRSSHVC
jgi:uncharacterized membrane protein YgcG